MGKNKKIFNKKRRNAGKSGIKKKKAGKDDEFVNKKALFNRYKDKQKVEEELAKKKLFERKLQQKQVVHSESDNEEDFYGQLLLSLNNGVKRKFTVCSEDESTSDEESEGKNDKKNIAKDIDVKTGEMDVQDSESIDSNKEDNGDTDESDSENEQEVSHDPFVQHLQYELSDELLVSLTNPSNTVKTITKHWPKLGNFIVTLPQPLVALTKNKKVKLLELLEEKNKKYAPTGTAPHVINNVDFNNLHIKSQIHGNIVSANKNNLIKRDLELNEVFTPLQKELFSIINNYQDLLYTERTFTNADEIRYTYCLHVVNHILKTRTKIIHHNAKLAKATDVTEEYRDQGLVRPKVVIMVPFKDAAYRVVNTLIDILMPKEAGKVVNRKRFQEDFTGGELKMPKKNPKPEDYELLFSGNTGDTFRMGLTLTKKSLKLYTDFYGSDIIIASPLGLRMLVGAEGEEDRDFDFLASIELLVMDQVDVFFMQNWEHVLHLLDHFHLQPKTLHGTDISRIRTWAANGWSKYYRQTLLFSSVPLPEISNIMNRRCNNYAGRVIVANPIDDGAMEEVLVQIPHYFHRFEADSPAASPEARLQCLIRDVLPLHRDSMMSHTLIYVPSYYDYVRVRNYLKREDITFVQICEYSKDSKIARARDMFFHTEAPLLLYSERAHFFRRFNLKGIRHIIFYQLPTYPHFYSEMCNLMQEHNQNKYGGSGLNMSVRVLYCKAYDMTRACGVVGASRLPTLMDEGTRLHTFRTSRS